MISILFSFLVLSSAEATEIKAFESDLCTLFPNGSWGHCCFEHDLHYWAGGTRERRKWTDLELRKCVADTGEKFVAKLIYRGVRAGHLFPFKIKDKKWGNGFPSRDAFKEHSADEIFLIVDELQHYDFDSQLKNKLVDSL